VYFPNQISAFTFVCRVSTCLPCASIQNSSKSIENFLLENSSPPHHSSFFVPKEIVFNKECGTVSLNASGRKFLLGLGKHLVSMKNNATVNHIITY
jgi:hypothetical protein